MNILYMPKGKQFPYKLYLVWRFMVCGETLLVKNEYKTKLIAVFNTVSIVLRWGGRTAVRLSDLNLTTANM